MTTGPSRRVARSPAAKRLGTLTGRIFHEADVYKTSAEQLAYWSF
jgi:hypothetical protein